MHYPADLGLRFDHAVPKAARPAAQRGTHNQTRAAAERACSELASGRAEDDAGGVGAAGLTASHQHPVGPRKLCRIKHRGSGGGGGLCHGNEPPNLANSAA